MQIPFSLRAGLCLGAALFAAGTALADVRLNGLFTDNMVLQRGKPVPVWGWADEGEKVTVEFNGKQASAVTKGGKWMVRLPSLKVGQPGTLKVKGHNEISLSNVVVGEVWICSGQSNMEWPLNRSFEPQKDIANSANSDLRLFTVPKLKSESPKDNVVGSWKISGPDSSKDFSAVGYYFGRDLQKALGMPVGLIHTSWGGSPAEVWMSWDVLESNPRYKSEIMDPSVEAIRKNKEDIAKWEEEKKAADAAGKQPSRGRPWDAWHPTELYNGMIAPLLPYGIAGAIWYQGESNAGKAHQYRDLFADMIRNWRRDWGQGDFSFFAVQLAPWDKSRRRTMEEITATPVESDWAELREAQLFTGNKLKNYGMAVITDVGDKDDIHPTKKEPVGARLALLARKTTYGQKIVANGPIYRSLKIKGDKAVLNFDSVGGGLSCPDGKLKGFAIAGADHKFVWANATINGNRVEVSSPEVSAPVAVRYGWAEYPVVNLFNKEGLPATPFRTDDFPMVTAPKK